MSDIVLKRLESYTAQARIILFLGAGFSVDAQNRDGVNLPGVTDLTNQLWDLAFPGEEIDAGSTLQDVFEAALLQARRPTLEALQSAFTVSPASLPDYYRQWFALPWYRVYTLNIDDLAEAADRAFDLPRAVAPVSAISEPFTSADGQLQVVHLNGRLGDLPNVTFSGRQYAVRLAQVDVWYANLIRELVSHPVLYVGTSLNEPPLWQYVEARGLRQRGAEVRPGSLLVTPSLPRARQVALGQYGIDWLPGSGSSFADEVLSQLGEASERGHGVTRRLLTSDEQLFVSLEEIISDSTDDFRELLMGREPRWSDISHEGFAIERVFDQELLARLEADDPKLVVLSGTAGSGKTACALRLLTRVRNDGARIVVLNEDADLRGHLVRQAIEHVDADVLFIEDLERLGQGALRILDDIAESRPELVVVCTVRSSRFDRLGLGGYISDRVGAIEALVPTLEDRDIDALLDSLSRANRLGALKGKTRAQQRSVLATKCGRQLLVAMIEATSGTRFDARIEDECRELSASGALVYAVVALASTFRIRIDAQLLIAAVGGDPTAQMRHVSELQRTHLLVTDQSGRLSLRHRVIAERTVEFFRRERMIETPIRGLAFALATVARPGHLRETRDGQALIRLINHDRLIEFLRSADGSQVDVVGIRGIYQELEPLLTQDHHFWLQRGSFETEVADLDLAKNFLEQARALAPEDPYVLTQWAYMTLKRASRRPEDPTSGDSVDAAFAELADVIERRGRRDSYPFHVYGSQGLAWVKRSGLASEEKERMLLHMRQVVADGIVLHPTNRELRQLSRDLEGEYLLLATT